MPRNGSGTMAIPNSFSPNTQISSAAVNGNFNDIGAEITNSLPRDGQAAMSGPLKAAAGSAAAPGIAFAADLDTGFFRKGGNIIGISCGGQEVGSFDAGGLLDVLGVRLSGIPTGCVFVWPAIVPPEGYVRCNGRTVGPSGSSATERANADAEDLYTFLWTNFAQAQCPVTGGRGGSAASDWGAAKLIAMPDWRGRAPFGLDDMGSTASGVLGNVITPANVNGQTGGAERVTVAQANLPNYTLPKTLALSGDQTGGLARNLSKTTDGVDSAGVTWIKDISFSTTTLSLTGDVQSGGSGTPLANMPPAFLTTFIMKL